MKIIVKKYDLKEKFGYYKCVKCAYPYGLTHLMNDDEVRTFDFVRGVMILNTFCPNCETQNKIDFKITKEKRELVKELHIERMKDE